MKRLLILLAIPLLAACSAVGVTPQTPNERLVVLEYSYQAALKTIGGMLDAGTLKGESASKAADLVTQAGASVRAARAAIRTGTGDTVSIINTANSLIIQLITYLETQKGVQHSWVTQSLLYKLYPHFSPQLERQVKLHSASKQHWIRREQKTGMFPIKSFL